MYFLDEALTGSADPVLCIIVLIRLPDVVSIRLLFSLRFFNTGVNFFLLWCLQVSLMSILLRTLIFGLVLKCTGSLLWTLFLVFHSWSWLLRILFSLVCKLILVSSPAIFVSLSVSPRITVVLLAVILLRRREFLLVIKMIILVVTTIGIELLSKSLRHFQIYALI